MEGPAAASSAAPSRAAPAAAPAPPRFELFSQSDFASGPVPEGLLACSPTSDLSASASEDRSVVYVRRRAAQIVSKHTERGQKAQALTWKADSSFLAVGWSDGLVRLTGLENSKAVHHIRVCEDKSSSITYISWSWNFVGERSSWQYLLQAANPFDDSQKKDILDLPHDLTFFEIDTSLPKMSPLPVSGGSGEDMFVFSTRTSLEFVFQPTAPKDNNIVHVMVVGTSDSRVHISIYDTFVIGSFNVTVPIGGEQVPLQLRRQAWDPRYTTHTLLMSPASSTDSHALYVVPMDLTFIPSSPVNLCLLASKTTTLQKLLRYIKQTQVHMMGEWQSARELPAKFLASIESDLRKVKRGPRTVVDVLYHTVITGHVSPEVKEWLVDGLGDRGHKRWDKAVTSGIENLRDLTHQNMLPAIERCTIILSRLLGIARFRGRRADIGFTSEQIRELLDIMMCLRLVAHKILLLTMEELDLFAVFSSWLRFEIDKATAPSSQQEDLIDREAFMEKHKVLAYIERFIAASPQEVYLAKLSDADWMATRQKDWTKHPSVPAGRDPRKGPKKPGNNSSGDAKDGAKTERKDETRLPLIEVLDRQLQKPKAGAPHLKALPRIEFLVSHLANRAGATLDDIAERQKRGVKFGPPTKLDIGSPVSKLDMCTHYVPKDRADWIGDETWTAFQGSGEHRNTIYLFQTAVTVVNSRTKGVSTKAGGITMAGDGTVVDFKLYRGLSIFILWRWNSKDRPRRVLVLKLSSPHLQYVPYSGEPNIAATALSPDGAGVDGSSAPSPFYWAVDVPVEQGFVPERMEVVVDHSISRVSAGRVCLLGSDGVTYRSFIFNEP